ncbi:MAG: CoA-binding protein [Candidatus Thorarchaeota archaeon]
MPSRSKSLDLLFMPRNIMIYEASEKLSYFIFGFKSQGFNFDNLYLVSPTQKKIFEYDTYQSVEQVPSDNIDLLILAVSREKLLESLKMILEKKQINFIHIFTAGTGEFDDIGVQIENELKIFLERQKNALAIGPNCMGVYSPKGHNAYLPMFPTVPGNISLIFHSGDLHSRTIMYGQYRYNLTFSKGVSLGNCVSLQVRDFLEYYEQDPDTEIIAIYFEGFSKHQEREGRHLFEILKKMKKPVLFLRGGKTIRGQTAVLSHTGSLGTSERIWNAVFKQTPLIEVGSSLNELIDYLYMFDYFFKKYGKYEFIERLKYYPKGKNALIILWSGGLGIIDTDRLTQLGINLPLFNENTVKILRNIYPIKVGSLSNPLDLPWVSRSEKYVELCKAAITDEIDFVVMHTNAWGMQDKERFESYYNNLKQIKEYIEAHNKLLIMILAETPQKIRNDYFETLIKDGFIVYSDLRRATLAFLALYNHGKQLNKFYKTHH